MYAQYVYLQASLLSVRILYPYFSLLLVCPSPLPLLPSFSAQLTKSHKAEVGILLQQYQSQLDEVKSTHQQQLHQVTFCRCIIIVDIHVYMYMYVYMYVYMYMYIYTFTHCYLYTVYCTCPRLYCLFH